MNMLKNIIDETQSPPGPTGPTGVTGGRALQDQLGLLADLPGPRVLPAPQA